MMKIAITLAIAFLVFPFFSAESRHFSTIATVNTPSPAEQNSRLRHELNWFFGGKAQRGWYLYQPLICRLIGVEGEADGRRFAEALSRWQPSVGLAATGVLDHESWMKMVSVFQSRRIKTRGASSAENLFQARADEFYDPERPDDLRYVDREAYAAYKRMLAAAAADPSLRRVEGISPAGNFLKIVSAFRSPAYQATLRARNPNSGRAGLAVNSPHFTGRALDLYVGGEPVSTKDQNRAIQINTPVYQWLVRNAERFGFHPYFYEPWHWEYHGMTR